MVETNIIKWFKEAWKEKSGEEYTQPLGGVPFCSNDSWEGHVVMEFALFIEKKAREEGFNTAVCLFRGGLDGCKMDYSQKEADVFKDLVNYWVNSKLEENKEAHQQGREEVWEFEANVKNKLKDCEKAKHIQQVAFSAFHNALTQVCFTCRKVRTEVNSSKVKNDGN